MYSLSEKKHTVTIGSKYADMSKKMIRDITRSWIKFCLFPEIAEPCRMPSMFPFPTHMFRKQFVQNTMCPTGMNVLRMNWQPYACYDQGFLWAYWASNNNPADSFMVNSAAGSDFNSTLFNTYVYGQPGLTNQFPGNSLSMINQPYYVSGNPIASPLFIQPTLANYGFSNFACNSTGNISIFSTQIASLNGNLTGSASPSTNTNTGAICTICNMIGPSSQSMYTGSQTTNNYDAVTQGGVRLLGAVFEISYVGTVQNMSGLVEIGALSHSKTQLVAQPSYDNFDTGNNWLPSPQFSADSVIVEQPYYKRYPIDQGGRCIWFPIDNQDFFFGQGVNSTISASSVNQNHAQLQWNINVTNIQPGQGLRINIVQYYEGIVGAPFYDLYLPERTPECATEADAKSAINMYAKSLAVTPARSSPVWDRVENFAGSELSAFVGFGGISKKSFGDESTMLLE